MKKSSSKLLLCRVAEYIQTHNLLRKGGKIVVGLSGGSDSTALLYLLHQLPLDLQLTAAYINHGLRPEESVKEERFVAKLCSELSIQHHIKYVPVSECAKAEKRSIEETARNLRYQALEAIRKQTGSQRIAVAHTADDQVEEFFIRIIRGTGLKGLAGMAARNETIIRPLLAEHKTSLIEYLAEHKLPHCYDSSNSDKRYLRNRVRLNLLPYLEQEFSAGIYDTVLRTMSIVRDEDDFLDMTCMEKLDYYQEHNILLLQPDQGYCRVNTQSVFDEHPVIIRRMLEKICWKLECRPSHHTLVDLQHLIHAGRTGSSLHLPNGLRVIRNSTEIIFSYPEGKAPRRGDSCSVPTYSIEITAPGTYDIPELEMKVVLETESCPGNGFSRDNATLFIDQGKVDYPLELRPPLPGERMQPLGGKGSKKIRRIFNDMKIPADTRSRLPILADRNGALAIVGKRIAERVKITNETKAALKITIA